MTRRSQVLAWIWIVDEKYIKGNQKHRLDSGLSLLDASVDATVAMGSEGVSGWYGGFSMELKVLKLPA
jgi:hypothetical protein